MKIFSYGSNMLSLRIIDRVKSYKYYAVGFIQGYSLKFHKVSKDGSGKANAFYTGKEEDVMWGVVGNISEKDKLILDAFEGLGKGYNEQVIEVNHTESSKVDAHIYIADKEFIQDGLVPYNWYREFVLKGAIENSLPKKYIENIQWIKSRKDENIGRREKNFRILKKANI